MQYVKQRVYLLRHGKTSWSLSSLRHYRARREMTAS
jgi:broad specificity phosphatase PhoE